MNQTIHNNSTSTQVLNNAVDGRKNPVIEERTAKMATPEIVKPDHQAEDKLDNKYSISEMEGKPQVKQEKTELDQKLDQFAFGVNCLGVVTSACTSLLQAVFKKNKNISKLLDRVASSMVSVSMGTNSAFNAYNSFRTKNICQLAGYGGELAIAALAPYNYKGLLRGLSFTLYQIPQIIGSGGKKVFKSFGENFDMLKKELPGAIASLFKRDGYTGENYERSVGAWGGLISTLGVFGWMFTGNDKLGGFVKGIGELLLDIFQVAPKQWKLGKVNYGMSGLSFIAGSLCDIISKQLGNEPSTRDLYFVGSGIGRIFMTRSNTLGEFNYDGKNAPELKPKELWQGLKDSILRNGKDKLHSALAA